MEPFWTDGQRTLYQGDAWELAGRLEPESLDAVCTSPPYWGLRDYGTADWEGGDAACDHSAGPKRTQAGFNERYFGKPPANSDKQSELMVPYRETCAKCSARRVDRQFGLEPHPSEYIAKLVDLFRRLRPALKRTGTVWLNLGDSFAGSGPARHENVGRANCNDTGGLDTRGMRDGHWLRPKQLLLIPSRVAIALQEDGWLLRNDMLWVKKNSMPSSVKDRFTCRYEHIFLFAKDGRAYSRMFDLEAVRESYNPNSIGRYDTPMQDTGKLICGRQPGRSYIAENSDVKPNPSGKNPGDVREEGIVKCLIGDEVMGLPESMVEAIRIWADSVDGEVPDVREWATQPFPEAHFATFPPALPEFCLRAGCAREVCAECGAGKVRRVESVGYERDREARNAGGESPGRTGKGKSGLSSFSGSELWSHKRSNPDRDLGFHATCTCGKPFLAGTVLDPFAGAGTTLAVAKDLGLRAIGFELSEEYAAMAARRIETWKRPKDQVEVEEAGQRTLFDA